MPTRLTPQEQAAIMSWPDNADIPIFEADTRNKRVYLPGWSDIDFSKIDFKAKLANGYYDDGIAIRLGKTLSGKYAAYSSAVDLDGMDAVIEWFGSWELDLCFFCFVIVALELNYLPSGLARIQ